MGKTLIDLTNISELIVFILVFCRLTSFIMYVPAFFPSGTPQRFKIGLSLVLTFIFVPLINITNLTVNNSATFIVLIEKEILIGLALGFITTLCFSAAQMAGQLLDFHVSFSMSSLYDPISNETVSILGRVFYWMCLIVFLLIDGHHIVINCLVESFQLVNIGGLALKPELATYMIQVVIEFFTIGLKMAIPIVLIIIITDFTLGLVARVMPQLNIMMLGMPIKILVGLACFTLSLPVFMKMIVNNFDTVLEAIKGLFNIMPCIFVFFASEGGEKTEEATPKKKSDAKKKGQVAKSKELTSALGLLVITLVISILGGYIVNSLKQTLTMFLRDYSTISIDNNSLRGIFITSFIRIAIVFLPVAIPIAIMGILANVAQSGKILTTEPLKPKLEKINPISGFKRMFSLKAVVDLIKNLIIIIIIAYVGYKFILSNYEQVLNFGSFRVEAILTSLGELIVDILSKVTLVMIIIGIIDFVYQKYQFNKDLKMTKQEVKEEFKQQEGDPVVKGKIKQKQREMSMKRMMQTIPDATVVITNPTHIAVALKYEENTKSAPKLIAKGQDNIAIKIKEIAKENNVPIIENKPLARLIYNEVELDTEIPYEMYQTVAEILAIVYKLNKKTKS